MGASKLEKVNVQATTTALATGANLIRMGNLRILSLSSYAGGNGALTIPQGDRPTAETMGMIMRRDTNGRSVAFGFADIPTSGVVGLYYAGTYNASGSGLSTVTTSDRATGQITWTVS